MKKNRKKSPRHIERVGGTPLPLLPYLLLECKDEKKRGSEKIGSEKKVEIKSPGHIERVGGTPLPLLPQLLLELRQLHVGELLL